MEMVEIEAGIIGMMAEMCGTEIEAYPLLVEEEEYAPVAEEITLFFLEQILCLLKQTKVKEAKDEESLHLEGGKEVVGPVQESASYRLKHLTDHQ